MQHRVPTLKKHLQMKGFHLNTWIGRRVETAIASVAGIAADWLGLRDASQFTREIHTVPLADEHGLYFGDSATKLFQLEQWIGDATGGELRRIGGLLCHISS